MVAVHANVNLYLLAKTCEKDQQDAHFFLIIYFNELSLACFEQIIVHHQEVYKQLKVFYHAY